jgi:signal transduction histidine kinase
LADTLNDLLARIEGATARQRQFVADAAHELRNPLAALRAELEINARHPEATPTSATDLLAETVRLSELVDDLLALARLDADIRPRPAPVDLDDLVLEHVVRIRGTAAHRIDTKGVRASRVHGDPNALRRVIANLVDNALRHAAASVTLELTGSRTGVRLVVADDGPGIRVADRERVFERFTRLDDARSRDAGGSGLGLAIVREIVTAHGGRIQIEDNDPGARFVVVLPAGGA